MVQIIDLAYLIEGFQIVIKAIPVTLWVSICAMVISLAIGIMVSVIRYEKIPILNQIAAAYVSIFRSTPNIAQIFLFYYGIGQISRIVNRMDPLVAAIIVLSFNAGAKAYGEDYYPFRQVKLKQEGHWLCLAESLCGILFYPKRFLSLFQDYLITMLILLKEPPLHL